MKTTARLSLVIVFLAVITPLGIILPAYFKAGDAWGEWSAETLRDMLGFVPKGLEKLSALWKAPLPDYAVRGWREKGVAHVSVATIISALIGVAAVVTIALLIGRLLIRKGGDKR
jgi:hypothetical protein